MCVEKEIELEKRAYFRLKPYTTYYGKCRCLIGVIRPRIIDVIHVLQHCVETREVSECQVKIKSLEQKLISLHRLLI